MGEGWVELLKNFPAALEKKLLKLGKVTLVLLKKFKRLRGTF